MKAHEFEYERWSVITSLLFSYRTIRIKDDSQTKEAPEVKEPPGFSLKHPILTPP